jgi:hypothetical protein
MVERLAVVEGRNLRVLEGDLERKWVVIIWIKCNY